MALIDSIFVLAVCSNVLTCVTSGGVTLGFGREPAVIILINVEILPVIAGNTLPPFRYVWLIYCGTVC